MPSALAPFAYRNISATIDPTNTLADFLEPIDKLFRESGGTLGDQAVLETKQARHAPGLLHRNDARIYALSGDVSEVTSGAPTSGVSAPSLGSTSATNSSSSATNSTPTSQTVAQNRDPSPQKELPSIFAVEVLGYGGKDDEDEEEERRRLQLDSGAV